MESLQSSLSRPKISVVVVSYNNFREIQRTLYSLSADYQIDIAPEEYEVIVVDNGSTPPFDARSIAGFRGNFRVVRINDAPKSPAHAANTGIAAAKGDVVGVMLDGSRMVTPGLLNYAWHGAQLHSAAVVVTLGWYLGRDHQRWAMQAHYDHEREDRLLQSVNWPQDGYRLFEIGAMDESSIDGWFGPIAESNGIFLKAEHWDTLGGYDERFDLPGGGLVNLDTFIRATELSGAQLVVLLGEATFHQLHGGVATNSSPDDIDREFQLWARQYETIRGRAWSLPRGTPRTYLGTLPPVALTHFVRALVSPAVGDPLAPAIDRALWTATVDREGDDLLIEPFLDLAERALREGRHVAAATIARMARALAPDAPSPQKLLATAGAYMPGVSGLQGNRLAEHSLAAAQGYLLQGDRAAAEAALLSAIDAAPDMTEAYVELSRLRMPGEMYFAWLQKFQDLLTPPTYLEIGVSGGHSIALAKPPTRAIGIDPLPAVICPFRTETHVYCEASDDFFAHPGLQDRLYHQPVKLAFIDGLHEFTQVLRDFINVEAVCARDSLILMHDTVPADEVTQRPERERGFYTGDVWKIVPCLKHFRPDLTIWTVATPWSGLTVIAGLDPASTVLKDAYDEAVAMFAHAPYEDMAADLNGALNMIENDWPTMVRLLEAAGVVSPQTVPELT